MSTTPRPAWILLASLALLLAGCTQTQPPGDDTDQPDAQWRDHAYLGSVLANDAGRTLYVFTPDPAGESTCTGGCAETWPPATVDLTPSGGPSDLEERLGAIEREDGTRQLTLDDRPLYRFAGDEAPGDANGQGRGGVWYVVRESDPAGQLNADVLDGPGQHAVTSSEATYGPEATGYLAQPDADGSFPGVVMIHEWWGLNDNIRTMADALATHGYAVLAVDLFNGSVAETADEAREQVGALNQSQATANMRQAADHLRTEVDASQIASLGWCFGGGQSLQLAISGEPLAATVLYYGTPLVTNASQLEAIDWPVQGVFGDEDQAIPVDEVDAFNASLDDVGVEHEIHLYEGVGHAFANPSGDAYAPERSMDAWAKTLAFLDEHLTSGSAGMDA